MRLVGAPQSHALATTRRRGIPAPPGLRTATSCELGGLMFPALMDTASLSRLQLAMAGCVTRLSPPLLLAIPFRVQAVSQRGAWRSPTREHVGVAPFGWLLPLSHGHACGQLQGASCVPARSGDTFSSHACGTLAGDRPPTRPPVRAEHSRGRSACAAPVAATAWLAQARGGRLLRAP